MSKKKKQKKYNPLKTIKSMARNLFMDIPTSTKVFKDKKKILRFTDLHQGPLNRVLPVLMFFDLTCVISKLNVS